MKKGHVRVLVWVAVAAGLALVGVAGVAYATSVVGTSSAVIEACRNQTSGILRVVGDNETCRAGEASLTWNVQGPKGDQGPQGPSGAFPGVLPSGVTLRGVYAARGTSSILNTKATSAVSFQFALPSAPAAHLVLVGQQAPPECPGSAAEPEASPGNLCVYERVNSSAYVVWIVNPVANQLNTSSRYGFYLMALAGSANSDFESDGTWAVTAP